MHVFGGKKAKAGGSRTVKVLEVGQLDALPHAQDVGCAAEAVEHHPDVSRVQGRDLVASFAALGATVAGESVLDVGPGGNQGGKHHQTEREEGHAGDAAAKPENLAICDENDGQVLEDGVDRDGQELEGLGRGVDHADQKERDGEPCGDLSVIEIGRFSKRHTFLGLICVEVSVGNDTCGLARLNCNDADHALQDGLAG